MRLISQGLFGAALLAVTGCAGTVDTGGWPAPSSLSATELVITNLYKTKCSKHTCTAVDARTFKDAMAALDAFIVGTYTEAFNTGKVTQALLDNVANLIAPITKLIADIEGRKR